MSSGTESQLKVAVQRMCCAKPNIIKIIQTHAPPRLQTQRHPRCQHGTQSKEPTSRYVSSNERGSILGMSMCQMNSDGFARPILSYEPGTTLLGCPKNGETGGGTLFGCLPPVEILVLPTSSPKATAIWLSIIWPSTQGNVWDNSKTKCVLSAACGIGSGFLLQKRHRT